MRNGELPFKKTQFLPPTYPKTAGQREGNIATQSDQGQLVEYLLESAVNKNAHSTGKHRRGSISFCFGVEMGVGSGRKEHLSGTLDGE